MKNQKLKGLIAAKANLLKSSSEATYLNDHELMMTLGGFDTTCPQNTCGTQTCGSNSCCTNSCTVQSCDIKCCESNV